MNPTSGIVKNDKIKVTLKRGESLDIEFDVYENLSGDCGPVAKGDPVNLTGLSLLASGEVEGVDIARPIVPIIVRAVTPGTDTVPARVNVQATADDVALVFQEGSLQSFTIQILSRSASGKYKEVGSGRVMVKDSASGALA